MKIEDDLKLWQEYKKTNSVELKKKLIEKYIPIVKYIAGRIAINLPPHIDIEDLYNEGIIGLIDAIEKYDLSKNVKFSTYASTRIRGSILDSLRAQDWAPRSLRKKIKEVEKVYSQLEHKLGRSPSQDEIAKELNMEKEQYYKLLHKMSSFSILSLDNMFEDTDSLERIKTTQAALEDYSNSINTKTVIMEVLKTLPENEKKIVYLYYWQDLTLKEIAKLLNLSEARVCQLHSQSILRLKVKLKEQLLQEIA